jgi:hypothetical protein
MNKFGQVIDQCIKETIDEVLLRRDFLMLNISKLIIWVK